MRPSSVCSVATTGILAALLVISGYFLFQSREETQKSPEGVVEGTFTQLTRQPGQELFPGLSPNGDFLIYSSKATGNWDIYLQRVGGEKLINLTEDSQVDDNQPSFSPKGKRIAFRSERGGGGIFVMGATGESVKRLTDFGFNPVWSPNGEEILFASRSVNSSGRAGNSRLWSVKLADGAKILITQEDAVQPNWSPNGHRIAYWGLQKGGGQRDIWTIHAGGGEAIPVTNDLATDWNPVWAPDGKHLFFASDRGGSMNIWRVPIDEKSGEILGRPQSVTTGVSSAELLFQVGGMRRTNQRRSYFRVKSQMSPSLFQ